MNRQRGKCVKNVIHVSHVYLYNLFNVILKPFSPFSVVQSLSFDDIFGVEVVENAEEAKRVVEPKMVPAWMKRENCMRTNEVQTNEANEGDPKLTLVLN